MTVIRLRPLTREALLARREQEILERQESYERLEDELRIRYARTEADLELREDKLDTRLGEMQEREQRLEKREQDLAGYVASVQQQFTAA